MPHRYPNKNRHDRELILGAPNSVQNWTVKSNSSSGFVTLLLLATSKLLSLINCYHYIS